MIPSLEARMGNIEYQDLLERSKQAFVFGLPIKDMRRKELCVLIVWLVEHTSLISTLMNFYNFAKEKENDNN